MKYGQQLERESVPEWSLRTLLFLFLLRHCLSDLGLQMICNAAGHKFVD